MITEQLEVFLSYFQLNLLYLVAMLYYLLHRELGSQHLTYGTKNMTTYA